MLRFVFRSVACFFVVIVFMSSDSTAQTFLRTEGKQILDEDDNPVLLRGMGLGGWMVQEGYMLQTAEFASPQHEIRKRIVDVVGEEGADEFYEGWLNNHVRKADIDSLKSWGFNSVRLPMHYNLFTLPIEEEPIEGQNTWLGKGFELTDNLIDWCRDNNMYVILDLHAAPGGQGMDSGISDYDPTKPSLWESAENRSKTVALWRRIAERYKDEPVVAGYDLLNEVNWNLPGGSLLRSLYGQITDAIREVDTKHIIFIEGNWFANDFTGLTPPWDDNMVYSPHKYWSINDQGSIQWVLDLRNTYNIPLYLGESGENSNVWFRDAIELLESNDIGWAWWPMKKIESIAGPLSVNKSFGYESLLNYWKGEGPKPNETSAMATLMQLTEDLKIERCTYQKDVVDAMFRQITTSETKPYVVNEIPGIVYATDFDMGTQGYAYFDEEVATYHVTTSNFTAWNNGWAYRNDGVDIETSQDFQNSNGFNVGWTGKDEWMLYTMDVKEDGVYDINLRTAGGEFGGKIRFSDNGVDLSPSTFVPYSGGYQDWETTVIEDVVLTQGEHKIKCHIDDSGFNLGSFEFVKISEINEVETKYVSGEIREKDEILIYINKELDTNSDVNVSDFAVLVNGGMITPANAVIDDDEARVIKLELGLDLTFDQVIRVSYSGNSILALDGTNLSTFTLEEIRNNLPNFVSLPAKIEAEDYVFQLGIQLENTTDTGGGQNIGFLDVNDFADYRVYVPESGRYQVSFRTAAESQIGEVRLDFLNEFNGSIANNTTSFSSTGGWQNWATTIDEIDIPEGYYTMRMTITKPLFNMNWMEFTFLSSTENEISIDEVTVYPNPGTGLFYLSSDVSYSKGLMIQVHDVNGRLVYQRKVNSQAELSALEIDLQKESSGMYLLSLRELQNNRLGISLRGNIPIYLID